MYMNLAISITVDLGLDKNYPDTSGFSGFSHEGLIENGQFTKSAKRAYLGCYFLLST
jgi:hypothetical protein